MRKMPQEMRSLRLEPETELKFSKSPTSSSPNRTLKLTNLTNSNVAFKVKTTAPKSYLVRPSSGSLKANEGCEVQIILQHQWDGSSHHRFLVQAVNMVSDDPLNKEQWSEIGNDMIQERKLNVVVEDLNDSRDIGTNSSISNNQADGPETADELKVKYEELLIYKKKIEKENQDYENKLKSLEQSSAGASSSKGSGLIAHVVVFLVTLVLALLVQSYVQK